MSLTNPNTPVSQQDLKDFYDKIKPYLGIYPPMVANKFSKGDLYDTSEKMVGKWIDGKPLYQRVITSTMPITQTYGTEVTKDISLGISVDKFVNVCIICGNDNTSFRVLPIIDKYGNDFAYVRYNAYSNDNSNANIIRLRNGVSLLNEVPVYIILQYTKVDDSANSFNIGEATDYSTEEKIVGTWIDGKPLYQKTILGLDFQVAAGSWTSTGVTIANADRIIGGFMGRNTDKSIIYPTAIKSVNGVINVYNLDSWSQCAYITIQYTKTTD